MAFSGSPDETKHSKAHLRIGELLVQEGLIKEADVQRVLSVQREEKALQRLPLGQILVRMGALSEANLKQLLCHPELKRNIGTLALERGLVTKEVLESSLAKKPPGTPIGEFLVNEGHLTAEQLAGLLKTQVNASKLGQLALKLKMISEQDYRKAIRVQKCPRTLGEILCDQGLINPLDLNYVLAKYEKHLDTAEILLRMGFTTKEQLQMARQDQKRSKEPLPAVLLKRRWITKEQLQSAWSKQYNLPFKELPEFVYSADQKRLLRGVLSPKYAEKHLILPISLKGKELTLAVFEPERIKSLFELKGMYRHFKVSCVLITKEKFEELFEILYSQRLDGTVSSEEVAEELVEEETDFISLDIEEELQQKDVEKPVYGVKDIEAEELVNFILKYGVIHGASDVHIEQDRKAVRLRYRIDGVLMEPNLGWLKEKLAKKVSAVISRIKVMANLDIAEKRLPQDGVFRINYFDRSEEKKFDLDFRVATCCGIVGENVTIRILDARKADIGLENLGHSPHVLDPLKKLLKSSAGMILVSGPTGSGKSSTLYGALRYIHHPGIKIITAEDPIEYSFPGIMQAQVNPKINLTFSRLLRSFLRLDPDVILVGEMRDEETAKIAFDAAQTGHLILSTVHTNDAVSTVSRLLELGVEYGQIVSCLMGVLAQRLVRRICTSCIEEYIPEEEEWGLLFERYPSHLNFYTGKGCERCLYTGYKGRTVISEIFIVESEIAQSLAKGLDEESLKKMTLEHGMKTMVEDGLQKLKEITLSEIIRVIPHEMVKSFRSRSQAQELAEKTHQEGTAKKLDITEREDPQPTCFTISNPAAEQGIIDLMRERYKALMSGNDSRLTAPESSLFREFIKETCQMIKERYGCRKVRFTLSQGTGNVEISAIPLN